MLKIVIIFLKGVSSIERNVYVDTFDLFCVRSTFKHLHETSQNQKIIALDKHVSACRIAIAFLKSKNTWFSNANIIFRNPNRPDAPTFFFVNFVVKREILVYPIKP